MKKKKLLSSREKIKAIAFQNDAFRSDIGSNRPNYPAIKGKVVVCSEISLLPKEQFEEIIYRTRDYDGFNKYNNPNGERNKGRFYYGKIDKDVVWEIQCYASRRMRNDENMDYSDVALTYRDLRIKLEPRL